MAPVDRREHRQQRVRGAGPSSVQASFGFSFGALGAKAAKQSSLPPQLSSRRTPVRGTPRGLNGSAQRNRSASVQRSGSAKPKKTLNRTITPQTGKRKRGSPNAQIEQEDGDVDELSPDRDGPVRSVEKSRRAPAVISPIREELDNDPDELSMLEEGTQSAQKFMAEDAREHGTPFLVSTRKNASVASRPQETTGTRNGGATVDTQPSAHQSPATAEVVAVTPGVVPTQRIRSSPHSAIAAGDGDQSMVQAEEESEDELSPPKQSGAGLRVIHKARTPLATTQQDVQEAEGMDVDELSSILESTPGQTTTSTGSKKEENRLANNVPRNRQSDTGPEKRGRPARATETRQDDILPSTTPAATRNNKTPEVADEETERSSHRPAKRGKRRATHEDEEQDLDELSPQADRNANIADEVIDLSNAEHGEEEREHDEEHGSAAPRLQRSDKSRPDKSTASASSPPKKQARKRVKLSGIKQAISVMRIKGSAVRGITVADTTRTILEDNIDHRLTKMVEKLQTSQDSSKRKELRGEINLTLSFKESMNEKLLDLQDANDVLSTNFKKMKLFKRDNAGLRKEILALQNDRQEVALEHDDIQDQYISEKAEAEAKNTLSLDMFAIEAAIQNGRKKARKEHREDEGPDVPLTMLLDDVSRNVGSTGNGGLIRNIKVFNGTLERAAGWLEGRA